MNNNDPPPAPDPVAVAKAQADANVKTATTQQQLNMVNQNTVQGKQAYTQTGTWADGTPKYELTTTLSPEQQGLYDQQTKLGSNFNNIALNQSNAISDTLSKPVDLSNEATEKRLFDLGSKRLDPQFARDWSARETALMNRGIMPGTEQYRNEQDAFGRQKNDAYDQLALTGRGQSVQEALAMRNQPINEMTALMSGGQVSMPSFGQTPQAGVANTDVAGIYNNSYQNQLQKYKIDQGSNNAMMGGLFGLGGAIAGGALGGPMGAKLGSSMGGWASGLMGS